MNRYSKTYGQPEKPDDLKPISNKLTIDLMGLQLSDAQLKSIRSEAVKAAIAATKRILSAAERVKDYAAFGTFSTFSTFSTFGSGAAAGERAE